MSLRSVDLNLIPVLRELLRERNVSKAGANLGLSQSATSAALARLRAALGDPLLVQVGRRMELTERAKELIGPVQLASEAAEAVWQRRDFDPTRATRRYVIATADYVSMILAPKLIRRLRTEAPGVTLQFIDITARTIERLRHGEIDFGILPRSVLDTVDASEIRSAPLFKDEFVAVVAQSAPRRRSNAPAQEAFATFRLGLAPSESAAERLAAGYVDNLSTTYSFQQFSILPMMALEAGLTALVQRRLAEKMAKYLPLKIVPSQISTEKIELHVIWSVVKHDDQAHRWFLNMMKQESRD
ncbi:MAG: LysR family transcriptional regulator [Alphaproteobacteria bacterium]|nr:LysR family transcriptional regulator [Alphaproteobacteria bacterium]MBL7097297.1 LysR family transcriptional regulator [Alphaproteobacteria bacterium]